MGKEACELLHTFKPSSLHKERELGPEELRWGSCATGIQSAIFNIAADRKHEERAPNTGL